jgi:hypothetical protein
MPPTTAQRLTRKPGHPDTTLTLTRLAAGQRRGAPGFANFDLHTGLPAPRLADGEYAMMVSLSHPSYRA